MASVNKVILIGNLGADPESRFAPSGDAICNIRLATTETWRDKNTGERREATEYFRRLVDACPDRLDLVNNIAWGLATAEWSPIPPEEVLALARRAQALHPEPHPVVLDTLAAAQANAGDFAAAVETAQTALAAIPPPATPQEAEGRRNIEFRLQEYRNQKPHREDAFRRLWTSMLQ